MTWLIDWIKALLAWLAGKSSQASTDQHATDTKTIDALEQRARIDDEVRRMSDADVTTGLQQWERGPKP